MQQRDFDEFCEILDATAEQYGKLLSANLKVLYWQGLVEYDLPAVRQALGLHMKNPDNGQFMPKIADIIRMMEGTTTDSALIAWAKVDKAVRQVGTQMSVAFDDPIIHKVLHEMGGWMSLGTKSLDEWPFVAKEFENRYRGYKMRADKDGYVAKMIGLIDANNGANGFKTENLVLIGDKAKAAAVLSGGVQAPAIGFQPIEKKLQLVKG